MWCMPSKGGSSSPARAGIGGFHLGGGGVFCPTPPALEWAVCGEESLWQGPS